MAGKKTQSAAQKAAAKKLVQYNKLVRGGMSKAEARKKVYGSSTKTASKKTTKKARKKTAKKAGKKTSSGPWYVSGEKFTSADKASEYAEMLAATGQKATISTRKPAKKKSRKKASKKRSGKKRASKKSIAQEVKGVMDQAAAMAKREYERGKREGRAAADCPPAKKAGKKRTSKKRASKKSTTAAAPKKTRKKRASKKSEPASVSASSILKAAKQAPAANQFWVCAGKTRTGCGGGARGGHVVTKKGSFIRLKP